MSADLHSSGKSSFYSSVMRMSEYYNLPDFDPTINTSFTTFGKSMFSCGQMYIDI